MIASQKTIDEVRAVSEGLSDERKSYSQRGLDRMLEPYEDAVEDVTIRGVKLTELDKPQLEKLVCWMIKTGAANEQEIKRQRDFALELGRAKRP